MIQLIMQINTSHAMERYKKYWSYCSFPYISIDYCMIHSHKEPIQMGMNILEMQ